MSDSLQPNGLQHVRFPCPSLSPRVSSNSYPLSQWCHPTISSSVTPFLPVCYLKYNTRNSFPYEFETAIQILSKSGNFSLWVNDLNLSRHKQMADIDGSMMPMKFHFSVLASGEAIQIHLVTVLLKGSSVPHWTKAILQLQSQGNNSKLFIFQEWVFQGKKKADNKGPVYLVY